MSTSTLIPVLPKDSSLDYLAEGAANVVYILSIRPPTPDPATLERFGDGPRPPAEVDVYDDEGNCQRVVLDVFDNKLLRLRKAGPNAIPCAESHESFLRVIVPLFEPDQIVDQCLVKIRPSKLVQELNGKLEDSESDRVSLYPRPVGRHGTYLADDEFGLLITDMRASSTHDLIAFKPKWLAQSPSAPEDSVRCRQCAYDARLNAAHKRNGETLKKTFCPLDLVSEDYDDVVRVAELILRPLNGKKVNKRKAKLFADWIYATPLLRRLCEKQVMLDPVGPINADVNDEKFRAAMTLRDVTLYLRFPKKVNNIIHCSEARLGDLDIKSVEKGPAWREKELTLINEGWYTGDEAEADAQPNDCVLSCN